MVAISCRSLRQRPRSRQAHALFIRQDRGHANASTCPPRNSPLRGQCDRPEPMLKQTNLPVPRLLIPSSLCPDLRPAQRAERPNGRRRKCGEAKPAAEGVCVSTQTHGGMTRPTWLPPSAAPPQRIAEYALLSPKHQRGRAAPGSAPWRWPLDERCVPALRAQLPRVRREYGQHEPLSDIDTAGS